MKTKNQLRYNRIIILFSLTALFLLPFISKAQLKVNSSGKVSVGTQASTTISLLVRDTAASSAGENLAQFEVSDATSAFVKITNGSSANSALYPVLAATATSNLPSLLIHANSLGGQDNGTNPLMCFRASIASNTVESRPLFQWQQGTGTAIMTMDKAGTLHIGSNNVGPKLDVVGTSNFTNDMTVNGDILGSGTFRYTSDQMFKTNVDSISNALALIIQLKPRTFYFDTTNAYGMNFSNEKQYGLIAQDVEQVLPELVSNATKTATFDTSGIVLTPAVTYKVLNYNAFTAIMLQGIKEQSNKIDNLETKTNKQDSIITSMQNQMNTLVSSINSCCDEHHNNGNHNGNHAANSFETNVELNDAQSIVLEQNRPNPFSEKTSINYSLPDNTVKAEMLFYNAQGKLIQSTELTQKGKGILNVFASDLSSGIYTYTLVVDGKIIETKKMVKQ